MMKTAMSYLSDISLRRGLWLLAVILVILVAGTWATVRITTQNLLDRNAKDTAHDWASFLAANVSDLALIAAGEQPSKRSLDFFKAARATGLVFRYIIYNREGYSQLISDSHGVSFVNISTFSHRAVEAIQTGRPVIDTKTATAPDMPEYFAEAFVPVRVGGQPVAAVAAYIDQTAQRAAFYRQILWASLTLCGLTALSFGVPAIAWYRRTREKQRADRRIQFLAHHDVLTGLANRARLIERLDAALAILPSTTALVAVHYIDIDHFKHVNDTLGHDGGDFLLSTTGARLRDVTRTEDMIARLGGDEFVVVQTGLVDQSQALDFGNRIASRLGRPVIFNDQEIRINLTIGIALAPADGTTPERLLKSADLALYNGKSGGRNCIRFFSPDMDEAMQKRTMLERVIRDAVAHNGFEVYYQPVFEMNGKSLVGFEALARLHGPDGTLIPPATFIPLAEELRLIDQIGSWILTEACRTAALWPENLTVAVNLSPAQFESGSIEEAVRQALQQSGLAPHRLELEITETLLLRNNDDTLQSLTKLKALGVSIVMDDFGTGYSSLSYLWKFPFDKIKIDRSFMESFEKSGPHVETVVKSIIALGREMSMRVTVEGVETPAQADFLYDAEADQVQGFYFGRPVPAADLGAGILDEFRKSFVAPQRNDKGLRVVGSSVDR
jgi:diguanylate cyclase (GGDEF)-like protein